jgi:hypothetical protein
MISFHFEKSIEMIEYSIDIKVRYEMKTHEIRNEFYNQFVAAKQVIVRIINEFFDSSSK